MRTLLGNFPTKESAVSSRMLPPKASSASRLLPCLHYIIMQIQTLGNSRGQRMVDPVVMYQNHVSPTKTHVVNLRDKQIVFPEDDDSDIIIVNEDYNRNTIEEERVESLKEDLYHLVDTTASYTEIATKVPNDAKEYTWRTTDWSMCSAPCGQKGHQVRGAVCQHKKNNNTTTVEAEECLSRGVTPPNVLRECSGVNCATWRTTTWFPPRCLASGAAVLRRRVECVSENGTALSDSSCSYSTQPEKIQREPHPCKPAWAVGPWSKCIGTCGSTGRQHRVLRCVWRVGGPRTEKARRRRERSAGAACEGMRRPNVSRACEVSPCAIDGVCRDTSRYCENVRAMNMCALRRYKEQCCKTCDN
ncbi:unnamed protein product [Parnassius apollo]|uniref:(apollo) hypothetical protein n=1 Tax=Parnassius apollo TaxID=110799 RepID=A0A8S3X2K6_PARAO|nr:unnamed protein product [Parnassius apollo]